MNDKLIYSSPASIWEETLPVGNGRMGASVHSQPTHDILHLNEETVWSGTARDKNNGDAGKYLDEIRKLLADGQTVQAEELINRHTLGDMCETYLPFGDLLIDFDREQDASGYVRTLDMKNGLVRAAYGGTGQCVFASYPDNLIIIKYTFKEKKSLSVSFASPLRYKTYTKNERLYISGVCPVSALPTVRGIYRPDVYDDEHPETAVKTCGALYVISDGGISYADDRVYIKDATCVEIRVSLATSFVSPFENPTADARARCEEPLDKAADIPYGTLLERHTADFSGLFSGFELSLGEDKYKDMPTDERIKAYENGSDDENLVALLVQYGRYLTISASRKGSRAMNLQGIWNASMRPAWCSNYTLNINTEMNYWGCEQTGLSECTFPLFKYIGELAVNGKKTARVHYRCGGWVAHCNSDIWAYTTTCGPVNDRRGCSRYATWQMGSAWLCRHLYLHYIYTKDEEFLHNTALPLMKGCAEFYLDFLTEDKNGYLVTSPSLSPENMYKNDRGESCCADVMPTMDITVLTDFFTECIELFDDGELKEKITAVKKKLPPISGRILPDGRLAEWSAPYAETEITHRHVSMLYGLYPAHIINENTPELMSACEKALDARGDESTGWGIIWRVCLRARLNDGERAYKVLKQLFHYIDDPARDKNAGIYKNLFAACPPFQIDANLGIVAAVCEMLVRDTENGLEILPALPERWKDGHMKGYVLRSGKKLDVYWENGRIINVGFA